jgi:hypothetical protein
MYTIGAYLAYVDETRVPLTVAETPTFSREADRILGEQSHERRSTIFTTKRFRYVGERSIESMQQANAWARGEDVPGMRLLAVIAHEPKAVERALRAVS